MTLNEAVEKMTALAKEAEERLSTYGFDTKIESEYMNSTFQTVEDPKKAKFATTALVVGGEGIAEGDEYCMSIGAQIVRGKIDDAQLERDSAKFNQMVDEMIATLEKHDDKIAGLNELTTKANEEYKKLMADIEENQKKIKKMSMIINIVFIVGLFILFLVAMLRS